MTVFRVYPLFDSEAAPWLLRETTWERITRTAGEFGTLVTYRSRGHGSFMICWERSEPHPKRKHGIWRRSGVVCRRTEMTDEYYINGELKRKHRRCDLRANVLTAIRDIGENVCGVPADELEKLIEQFNQREDY